MTATTTARTSLRGARLRACLLAAGTVVVLAGCGAGDRATADELTTATATASATPSPTSSTTATPSASPAATVTPPEPTPGPEPTPDPEPTPAVPAPVVEAPKPKTPAAPAAPAAPAPPVPAPPVPAAPAPAPVQAAPPPVVQASGSASTTGAQALFAALNGARSAAGLAPLAYSSALESVASTWTSSMAGSGSLGHNPSYSAQIPVGWTSAGENVGYAGGYPDDAATIHSGWMASTGHRENILSARFTQVGIGYVVDATGTAWATQVFAGY